MNMRKTIAVLAAVLLLCAAIPMAALSVAAAGELLYADYDTTVALNGTGTSVIDENGNKILQWDTNHASWANISKAINVDANTTYNISLKIKSNMTNSVSVKFLLHDWATVVSTVSIKPTSDWVTHEFQLTSDTNTSVLFMIQTTTNANSGQTIYLDDIIITKPVTLTEGSNLFVNGDFETGNTNGWNKHQQTSVTAGAAKDGSYGAYLNGPSASWGGVLDQNVNVVNGKRYVLSFDFKAIRQGFNWTLSGVQTGKTYAGGYESATEWTHIEKYFTVDGDTQLKLNFNCGGGSGTDEMYLDNVSLLKVREMSNDGYLLNGNFDMGNADNWTPLWNSTTLEIVEGGYNSDYALKGTASSAWNITYQEIAVEANTDYIVSVWAKDATNAALWTKGVDSAGEHDLKSIDFAAGSEWKQYSVEINSGAYTKVWVGLMGKATGATYVVDDVLVLKKIAPSNDGYIYNGNFESGKKESFVCDQQTVISMDAAKDGNFGAHLKGSGWGGLLGYTFDVEPGATYVLSYDAKANVNGFNSAVLADTWKGEKLANRTFSSTQWTTIDLEFVATTNKCYLNLNGYSETGQVDCYVDNVRVVKTKDAHVCSYVETSRTDATCGADGSVTYTCSCGDSYTQPLPATGEHTYFDDCSAICEVCGYEREVSHNIVHVEAKAATCVAMGNIEFWYCDVCGMAWLDEACTLNTNMMAVKLPATGEHTYDNDFDADCNVCGAVRSVVNPITFAGKSIAENDYGAGLAFKFDLTLEGVAIKNNTWNRADFTNATLGDYNVIRVGAIATNGKSTIDIAGVHMCEFEGNHVSFAYRIIDIPESGYDTEITMTPYIVLEIDGVETIIEGEAQTASYNQVAAENNG